MTWESKHYKPKYSLTRKHLILTQSWLKYITNAKQILWNNSNKSPNTAVSWWYTFQWALRMIMWMAVFFTQKHFIDICKLWSMMIVHVLWDQADENLNQLMTSSWQTLIYRIIINKKILLCFFCIENHIRLFYMLMGTQHACGHHEAIKMFSYVAMWQCQKLCVGGNSLHCIFKPREGTCNH